MLPTHEHPDLFGQHPNADIASQIAETRSLFDTLLSLQPQVTSASAAGAGPSREDKVRASTTDIMGQKWAECSPQNAFLFSYFCNISLPVSRNAVSQVLCGGKSCPEWILAVSNNVFVLSPGVRSVSGRAPDHPAHHRLRGRQLALPGSFTPGCGFAARDPEIQRPADYDQVSTARSGFSFLPRIPKQIQNFSRLKAHLLPFWNEC